MRNEGRGHALRPGSPVNFGHVWFNEGMEYKNGVFLIRKPGYYQVGVNLTPAGRGDIGAYIMVNGKHGNGYAKGSNGSSLSMVSIVKLELYDSIYVRIFEGITSTAMDANTFQIAKIN